MTTAYCDVLVARELQKIAEEDLAQKQRHLDETTKRQSAGTATDYDVLAAQVVVENARPAVIRAQNTVRVARMQLAFCWPKPARSTSTGTLGVPLEAVPSYESVLARALANRPELAAQEDTLGVYKELVTIARAASKPRVDFSAAWGMGRIALPSVSSSGYLWNAGVVASVPLFDGWRTKGQVAQAQTDLARAGLDDQKLRDGIAVAVRTAVDAVREASEIEKAHERHRDAGRAAPVPRREGVRVRREDASRGAGCRAEPVDGARQSRAGAARLPRRTRQSRLGGGDAGQVGRSRAAGSSVGQGFSLA